MDTQVSYTLVYIYFIFYFSLNDEPHPSWFHNIKFNLLFYNMLSFNVHMTT